jgi:hypothetical protein
VHVILDGSDAPPKLFECERECCIKWPQCLNFRSSIGLPNANVAERPKQPKSLLQPDDHQDDNHGIEDRFDLAIHRDIGCTMFILLLALLGADPLLVNPPSMQLITMSHGLHGH